MNIYAWIALVLLCALTIPIIWTSVSRCQKCHGFCEDEESCKLKIQIDQQHETERQNHGQKENSNPT